MERKVRRKLEDVEVAVVVGHHVERLLVGRDADPVGLSRIGDDLMDRSVRVDPVDRHHSLLHGLVADIAGIGEVDPTLEIDADVVGGIELSPVIEIPDDHALAGLHVRSSDAPASEVRPFGHDHVPLGIEFDSVGHARWGIDRR